MTVQRRFVSAHDNEMPARPGSWCGQRIARNGLDRAAQFLGDAPITPSLCVEPSNALLPVDVAELHLYPGEGEIDGGCVERLGDRLVSALVVGLLVGVIDVVPGQWSHPSVRERYGLSLGGPSAGARLRP